MSNKKIKKYIKLCIVILILLLLILVIGMLILKVTSKEQMLKRLTLSLNNLNYNYTIDDTESKVYVVGKYEKIITPEKEIYNDYENKITKEIDLKTSNVEEYSNNGISDMQYYKEYIEEYFNKDYYTYIYKGNKDLNGKSCTLIEFSNNNNYDETFIWIDNTNNLVRKVEKYQYYYRFGSNEKGKIFDEEYDYDIASNKPEDIKISEETLTTHSSDTNN